MKSPKPPAPPPVVPLPQMDDDTVRNAMRAARKKLRKGRTSTMVSGQLGDTDRASTAPAQLVSGLGSSAAYG